MNSMFDIFDWRARVHANERVYNKHEQHTLTTTKTRTREEHLRNFAAVAELNKQTPATNASIM